MNVGKYRQLAQKNEQENYFLDKLFFRKISIYLTIIFIKLKVTPNQATFLSLVSALASLYFLTGSSRGMLLTAAALIFLYYLLDHVDGELARYYIQTGVMKPSLKGHYFDVLVHRYSSNLMVFFLGLGLYKHDGNELALLLGFLACIGISSFPNVIAAQVLVGKIATDPQALHEEKTRGILLELEKKTRQVADLQGSMLQKVRKIAIESLFFPGHILLLILVLILDAFLGDFVLGPHRVNLRLILLVLLAFLYTAKTLAQGILWIHKFKDVS